MLEALIASERDAGQDPGVERSPGRPLQRPPRGRARQIIDNVAFLDRSISRLSVEIAERTTPFVD